jgi:hypothetical protein
MTIRGISLGMLAIALAGIMTTGAATQTGGLPEHLTAVAINMGSIGRLRSGIVDILVFRWATREELAGMVEALRDRGSDGLFDRLRDSPRVGFIRTPDNLSYNIRFAWTEPTSDGRRIILATDRFLRFWDAMQSPAIGYPFTVIEIHLSGDGGGEGKMSITTAVSVVEGATSIGHADYASEPVRLAAVQGTGRVAP